MRVLQDHERCPDCEHMGHMHFRQSSGRPGGCYAQIQSDQSTHMKRCVCRTSCRAEKEEVRGD